MSEVKPQMPSFGPMEIVIILVVAFLLFGVGLVTKGAESLGTGIRQFRSGFRDDESREEPNKGDETSTGEEPR